MGCVIVCRHGWKHVMKNFEFSPRSFFSKDVVDSKISLLLKDPFTGKLLLVKTGSIIRRTVFVSVHCK